MSGTSIIAQISMPLRVKIATKSSELHEVLPHHTRQNLTDYTNSNID